MTFLPLACVKWYLSTAELGSTLLLWSHSEDVYFSLPVLLFPEGNLLKANLGVKAAKKELRTPLNSPTGTEQVPSRSILLSLRKWPPSEQGCREAKTIVAKVRDSPSELQGKSHHFLPESEYFSSGNRSSFPVLPFFLG